jgi:hypothetical protein
VVLRALAILTMLATIGGPAFGEERDKAAATKPVKLRSFAVRHPLPFKLNEKLVYDVKFSRFPISANVGELTFLVDDVPGSDSHLKFVVTAVSRGALVRLFGVKVNDTFTSLADRDDLAVYSTIKTLHEGDYHAYEEAVFDRTAGRVRYKLVNLAKPAEPERVVEQETRPWVQDLVSAVYFARTRNLKNLNREVHFPLSDRGETRDIGIVLVARERVKTDAGSFAALKLDVRIFDGRLLNKEGQLFVWLSDDERRVPVKAEMKLPAGTVTFDLQSLGEGDVAIDASARERARLASVDARGGANDEE